MIMPRLKYPLQTTSDGYQSSLEPLSYETDRLYRMQNNNQKTQKVVAKPQIRLNDKKNNNKNCRQVVELSQCFKPQIIYSLDIQYCQIKKRALYFGCLFFHFLTHLRSTLESGHKLQSWISSRNLLKFL